MLARIVEDARGRMLGRPLWHWVLIAGLTVWTGVGLLQWLGAAPLGHDESQYAITARDLLAGESQRWFNAPIGMNAIAVPGVLLESGEHGLRFVPFLVGLCFIGVVWLLARSVFGPETAAWSIAVLAGCRSLIHRSTDLLTDVPATTCVLGALFLLATELARDDGPRRRFVLVAPLLAGAFYVRYGSVVPIAAIVLVTVLVLGRGIARRPVIIVDTALLFLVLMAPHLGMSMRDTGSPLGILFANNGIVGGEHGDALVTYVTQRDPFKYFGLLAPPLMLAGLSAALPFRRDRRIVFVWACAIATFLALGTLTHGQPRYVFIPTVLLVILGVHVVRTFARSRWMGLIAICAIVVAWISVTRKALLYPAHQRAALAPTLDAARRIRREAAGQPCIVVGTHGPQLEWYSGCRFEPDVPSHTTRRVFVVD